MPCTHTHNITTYYYYNNQSPAYDTFFEHNTEHFRDCCMQQQRGGEKKTQNSKLKQKLTLLTKKAKRMVYTRIYIYIRHAATAIIVAYCMLRIYKIQNLLENHKTPLTHDLVCIYKHTWYMICTDDKYCTMCRSFFQFSAWGAAQVL